MEKRKRWQFAVIVTAIVLTLYNILPTIIYYSKPLSKEVDEKSAQVIACDIGDRVNGLEQDAKEWVYSFSNLLKIKPKSVQIKEQDPSLIEIEFQKSQDLDRFKRFLPAAGLEIPFVPEQLSLINGSNENSATVSRRISIHFDDKDYDKLFRFTKKVDDNGNVTPFYFELSSDRIANVASTLQGGAAQVREINEVLESSESQGDALSLLAQKLLTVSSHFGENSPFIQRYYKTFFQVEEKGNSVFLQISNRFADELKRCSLQKKAIEDEGRKKAEKGEFISSSQQEYASFLGEQIATYEKVIQLIKKNENLFQNSKASFSNNQAVAYLAKSYNKNPSAQAVVKLSLGDLHPFFNEVVVDWENDCFSLHLHPDVLKILNQKETNEVDHLQKETIRRLLLNEVARVQQQTDEKIISLPSEFRVNLYQLQDSKSILAIDLTQVASKLEKLTLSQIMSEWKPSTPEFSKDQYPEFDKESFSKASSGDKKLCLAVIAPTSKDEGIQGLRPGSLYVVLRGALSMVDNYEKMQGSKESQQFFQDFNKLGELLYRRGFIGYSGASLGLNPDLGLDYVFELDDYYSTLIKATREDFSVLGNKEHAVLEFSNLEQRLLTKNRIDDAAQDDLVRWKEAYQAAQVSVDPSRQFLVPKPTKNAFWGNCKLSFKKYFRGDERRVLRWGLDLSGGKSVRIALVDSTGKQVENPDDLKQAVNELYSRINKMGVQERTLRIENSTVLLDFPGSRGISAGDLIKASAMYFHIANEQFGPFNKVLSKEVNEFLQEIWNEAVVTNRRDVDSLNEIAYQKLELAQHGSSVGPKSAAQVLYEKGLRLANPSQSAPSQAFNDSLSMIARFQGDDSLEWANERHPLLVVFKNYALEGSCLENIQVGYDPTKGNILVFGVQSSYPKHSVEGNPRDDFYSWTSKFSEENIRGTPLEGYSSGRGYRMAVILNGEVVSAPTLNQPLRDSAMISGNFSQREISKLATNLKAGSLSFSPKILSEYNVSPELGTQARKQGIVASVVAIILVVAAMVGYYRFAGIVASVAVLFNVLIIWAVLQNIEAALTLPGIAGIVLTIGMAVDANVLVFERIREEFKSTGRLSPSIHAGYRKAFSAILDSNLTTILAALILLQFDCGPIRAFAVTMIIGITSSMFSALFMTRYFFSSWLEKTKASSLKMSEWISPKNYNFLGKTKIAVIASIAVVIVGMSLFVANWKEMLGMDFTGGYSITLELEKPKVDAISLPQKVSSALVVNGVRNQEFQIRELGRDDLIRLQLSIALEEEGRPFYKLPTEETNANFTYDYEKNPRIRWVVDTLKANGVEIKPAELPTLQLHWTAMSGQLSSAMRNNAIIALVLSLVGVLIYITFRFEWKYAVSSVLALVHDVILTLSVVAIAHAIRIPVQINLEMIGAIMTIIGYSLNDTIIIFDRIREDVKLYRKKSFYEVINGALNQTLSRTLMTSGTTLLVLVSLLLFGGSSIFGFSFIMTVGVLLGTISSLFIASPILLWLNEREEKTSSRVTE